MAAPRRENNPARKPDLTIAELKADSSVDPHRDWKAAQFINAKGLNKINKSRGETVAGNLARALDLAEGPAGEARDKSLRKTHDITGGYGAGQRGTPWTSADKYGDKYDKSN